MISQRLQSFLTLGATSKKGANKGILRFIAGVFDLMVKGKVAH